MDYRQLAVTDGHWTSEQFSRREWDEKGYCVSRTPLNGGLVAELQRRVDAVVQGRYETGREPLRYRPTANSRQNHIEMYSHVHWSDTLISSVALDPLLAEFAGSLLGARRIRLWGTSIIYKYGAVGAVNDVAWHRDMTFWQCVSAPRLLTFWIALDDTSEENGCLEYATGSHHYAMGAQLPHDHDLYLYPSEPMRMRKGQVAVHHCLTGHRSNANRSSGPRRALTVHLMDGDLCYIPGSPSDDHMNVYLLGKVVPSDFDNPYFPLLYDAA